MADLEAEAAMVEAEVVGLRDEVRRFLRNPLDTLLPGGIGPLLRVVTGRSGKK